MQLNALLFFQNACVLIVYLFAINKEERAAKLTFFLAFSENMMMAMLMFTTNYAQFLSDLVSFERLKVFNVLTFSIRSFIKN